MCSSVRSACCTAHLWFEGRPFRSPKANRSPRESSGSSLIPNEESLLASATPVLLATERVHRQMARSHGTTECPRWNALTWAVRGGLRELRGSVVPLALRAIEVAGQRARRRRSPAGNRLLTATALREEEQCTTEALPPIRDRTAVSVSRAAPARPASE